MCWVRNEPYIIAAVSIKCFLGRIIMDIDQRIKQAMAYREILTNPVWIVLQGAKIYDLLQIKKEMINKTKR